MMNIIIGKRSNLSKHLEVAIASSKLISSDSITAELGKINWKSYSQVNLIFNQFQPATLLNDLGSPTDYIDRSIGSTATVLEFVKASRIRVNKIIYTSSSSVYGSNESCHEDDALLPTSLHAALKAANEKLVIKFCQQMGIDYTIARIFNMYGGNDNFSIVSKIISAFTKEKLLTLVNQGEAIRDFIYIKDVVCAYQKILTATHIPVINVASGEGKSIDSILFFLKKNKIRIKTSNIEFDEIKVSIADNSKLLTLLGKYQFQDVEEYVLKRTSS